MTIYPIFIVGSIWFWLLGILFIIGMVNLIEEAHPFGAFFLVLFYLGLIHFFGDMDVFSVIADNPMKTISYTALYVAIGFVWSFIRLALWARKDKRYKADLAETYAEFRSDPNYKLIIEKPRFIDVKDKVVTWIVYWPFSMAWALLRDFIMRPIEKLVDLLRGMYDVVLSKCWGDLPETMNLNQEDKGDGTV